MPGPKGTMRARTRTRHDRAAIVVTALALAACAAAPARAGLPAPFGAEVALLAGTTRLDARLADYQWDVAPRLAWGAEALGTLGRWGVGARFWHAATTQALGLGGATSDPAVGTTSVEAVARGRLASIAGTAIHAVGSAGRLHVGYHPDHVTVDPTGGGTPLEIRLAPVDTWMFGGGLALERRLAGPWSASFEVDRRAYGWDTAHRVADTIQVGRESFGDWSAHLGIAWKAGRR